MAIVVNSAVIAVWIVSRTIGLPIGPHPWQPEAIGLLDLFATGFEVALVGVLLPTVAPHRFRSVATGRMHYEQAFVLGAFCIVTIALLTTVALVGSMGAGDLT
jgi:hypothetical protein